MAIAVSHNQRVLYLVQLFGSKSHDAPDGLVEAAAS